MSQPRARQIDDDAPARLGRAIRRRRQAMGMTLVQVAEACERTKGFLSQVERGISSPSLSSLMAIAAALQTSVEQLLSVPEVYSEYVPKAARQSYTIGKAGRFYERLGPGFPGALLHAQIVHRPAGHVSEQMRHTGEVFCYLMSGKMEYHLGGAVYQMTEGDVIHHDTSKPHFSKVLSDSGTVELWVSNAPVSDSEQE